MESERKGRVPGELAGLLPDGQGPLPHGVPFECGAHQAGNRLLSGMDIELLFLDDLRSEFERVRPRP